MSKADDAKSPVQQALDKGLVAQQASARQNVERLRRVNPSDTPQELIRRLDRSYRRCIAKSGGVSGVTAIVPGAKIPTALADVMGFTEASVLYLLSLAEVHGLHPEDFERRELLVSTVLLGREAVRGLDKVIEHAGPSWARRIVYATPSSAINRANKVLRPQFVTKYGTKRGVLVLSELVPLGVGAALGITGHLALGWPTIKSARAFLGQPPSSWAGDDRGHEVPFVPGSGDSTP
ncbi:YcjF family protein [Streptomyces sp. ISL-100]|uniref:YcjF family protein n=1 Tax=Streptomyces sp. ISL-100 TaxID=2819173 RepID=UPI001BEBFB09|nr:YcjF family protein [Streptomyces sp. ISL-100]MBT2398319.1 hypothetical protein [Streptomyces sp. ISL-100]